MCRRIAVLMYAGGGYVVAMLNLAYVAAFLADAWVPKGITDGPGGPAWLALLVDTALIALFGLHHSITARRRFKSWWTSIVPQVVERPTYLYMTAIMTGILVVFWRPIPIEVWHIEGSGAATAVIVLYLGVWVMMFLATFHFGHLSFFGLQPILDRLRRLPPRRGTFAARYLYAVVRHPIALGWMLVPWLTPRMTVGQLVFALATAGYVLVATRYEEIDLVAELGDDYRRYRTRVPAFVPGAPARPLHPPGTKEQTP